MMQARKVFRGIRVFLLTAAFAALSLGALAAPPSPPGRINYQGVLRDSAGAPLDGLQTMTFRFYDDPTAGTILWEETYSPTKPPQVTVSSGLFTVALGDAAHWTAGIEPLFPGVFSNNTPIYLAVAVGLDAEMTPRIQVVSAPYALNSDTLDGIESSMFAKFAGSGTITANWVNTAFPWADNEVSNTLTLGAGSTIDPSIAVGNANTLDTFDSSYFLNTSATDQTKAGKLTLNDTVDYGVDASGPAGGGYFHGPLSGYATVGSGDFGILAYGNFVGGYFEDLDGSGVGLVGSGDVGIHAEGNSAGGYFKDKNNSGYANVGYGDEGIHAEGNTAGGYFKDFNGSGYANVGYGDVGIDGYGSTAGGYFHGPLSGYARAAYGEVGVHAEGNTAGGYFKDRDNTGYAYLGYGEVGIHGVGLFAGGSFRDSNNSGFVEVASGDVGIYSEGNYAGGQFDDLNSSGYASVGYDTYKIQGTGTVSFIQNHPVEKDKVIVYACPEGDEIATYTRGTAKLVNGETRVILGETFQWVTNPDIGLTAHLTPKGDCNGLYTESVSTTEMVVKELNSGKSNTTFDYIVYGLRIGFEESSIVQEKQRESYIPSFNDHRERYAKYPQLRAFNSLERFKTMESSVRGVPAVSIDLSRARALKGAIHEYDPDTDEPVETLFGRDHGQNPSDAPQPSGLSPLSAPQPGHLSSQPVALSDNTPANATGEPAGGGATIIPHPGLSCLPVSESVEPGDVVVIDLSRKGNVRRCAAMADPLVVGIAADSAEGCRLGQHEKEGFAVARVPVASFGIVSCKVDAGFGPIHEGDLLVASPTSGHAMRAQSIEPGTVIGKALESLKVGTGKIQVLIVLR